MLTPGQLEYLERGGFTHAVVTWVGADGYPVSVATPYSIDRDAGTIVLAVPAAPAAPPEDTPLTVIFSHIRPQPGIGYDERRWLSVWGTLTLVDGSLRVEVERIAGWDEQRMSFFEYCERSLQRAKGYMGRLAGERRQAVRPKLSPGWLFLRTTRLPFLSATIVPVGLGIAVAAREGHFDPWLALLTLAGAACIHLGLNVANDVFDTLSGADAANVNPTQYSGGSRVVLYGLVRMRTLVLVSAAFYSAGIGIGVVLAVTRGFWPLLWLGVAGVAVSVAYTAPPLRLVHRGLGEVAVGLGFGPIMVLGAYFVQAQRFSLDAAYAAIPVGILVALILYVNEVPDRAGDSIAGKRTLPVRLSPRAVLAGYRGAAAAALLLVVAGAVLGLVPRPGLLVLACVPAVLAVARGLRLSYDSPYELMPVMGRNIQLHALVGVILIAAYALAAVQHALPALPSLLG